MAIGFLRSSVAPDGLREHPDFVLEQRKQQAGSVRLQLLFCTLPREWADAGATAAGQVSLIWENPALIFKAMCCGSAGYGNFITKLNARYVRLYASIWSAVVAAATARYACSPLQAESQHFPTYLGFSNGSVNPGTAQGKVRC